jgi:hypothetical protein
VKCNDAAPEAMERNLTSFSDAFSSVHCLLSPRVSFRWKPTVLYRLCTSVRQICGFVSSGGLMNFKKLRVVKKGPKPDFPRLRHFCPAFVKIDAFGAVVCSALGQTRAP